MPLLKDTNFPSMLWDSDKDQNQTLQVNYNIY